jgi:branched-chain amino acid transport system substrate-binding protein
MPKFDMPYKIVETIAYDPKARDLSVESPRRRPPAPSAAVVSRLNDAILLTRELVKQRWTPMGVLSMGPGWYEDQYLKTLGKLSDGPISFVPWYDPNKKLSKQLEAALAKALPRHQPQHQPHLHVRGAAGRRRRLQAGRSTDPKALADAIRATNITDNVSTGPGIMFNAKGQNDKLQEFGDPEPRRQACDGRAEGGDQRQGGMADGALRQAR